MRKKSFAAGRAAACGRLARTAKRARGRPARRIVRVASTRSGTRTDCGSVALLDGETPLGIFRRLLVGSEGTLAFIRGKRLLETIPAPRVTRRGMDSSPHDRRSDSSCSWPRQPRRPPPSRLMIAPALNRGRSGLCGNAPPTGEPSIPKRCSCSWRSAPRTRDSLEATQHQVLELVKCRQADQASRVHERRRGHRLAWQSERTSGVWSAKNRPEARRHHGGRLFSAGTFGTGVRTTCRNTCQAWVHPVSRTRSSREPSFHSRRGSRWRRGTVPVLGLHDELVDLVVGKHDGSLKAASTEPAGTWRHSSHRNGVRNATAMMWRI